MSTKAEFLGSLPPDMEAGQAAKRWKRQQAGQQAKQGAQWRDFDALLTSRAFQEYLSEHDLELRRRWGGSPSDLGAEQSALGATLYPVLVLSDCATPEALQTFLETKRRAVEAVVRRLRPWHLHSQVNHVPILMAIAALYQRNRGDGSSVDIVTVASELRRMGALCVADNDWPSTDPRGDGLGIPTSYLVALVEACPSAWNVHAYIDAVIETAQLRMLLRLSEQLHDLSAANQTPPSQIVNFLRKAADAIEQGKGAPDFDALLETTK